MTRAQPNQTPCPGAQSPASTGVIGLLGLIAGPLVALAIFWLAPDSMEAQARATAAVGSLMAIWWMTEAIPLPATSLLPIALFPVLGVLPIKQTTAPYAHPFIFLFMGGFMLALAMQRWGLHKRIALRTLLLFGTSERRIVAGFMAATATLSMWVSNTATTVMMLPIAVSVLSLTSNNNDEDDEQYNRSPLALCLLLGVAYAASIGGVATIIGTPPNVFLVGYLRDSLGIEVSFVQWMSIGLPLSIVFIIIAWAMLVFVLHPVGSSTIRGGKSVIRDELRALGKPSRGEWVVFVVFMCTALAWLTRQPLTDWALIAEALPMLERLDDAGIAIIAALTLFIIPINLKTRTFALDWPTARQLPWGVLLLFGGGLSLAAAVQTSGLDAWIGDRAVVLSGAPTWLIILAITALVIFLTEVTSNTATAATFLPILGGAAVGLGIEPLMLVIPAALAASCAFMMPVATPPNAIVFGSGRISIQDMLKTGFWLNLIGIVLITGCAYTSVAWALGGLAP